MSTIQKLKLIASQSVTTETYSGGISLVRFPIIAVDYAAIARAGGYGRLLRQAADGENINRSLTQSYFPVSGDGLVYFEPAILAFGRDASSEEVVETAAALCPEDPWAVGEIAGLCAFTGAHPDLQRANPIPALGSVAEVFGSRRVPYAHGVDARRRLDLYGWVGDWGAGCRFFVARNASQSGARASA